MGTNYYIRQRVCECCGHEPEALHIGKSSAGWCFSLRVYPERGITTLEHWKPLFEAGPIEDEYGRPVMAGQMLATITQRSHPNGDRVPFGYPSWEAFHHNNHSEPGPNGLVRHAGGYGHGEGTWDYIVGDFS